MASSKSQTENITEPEILNTNNNIFGSSKERDGVKTSMQPFDDKKDINCIHIVYFAACIKCVKGKQKDARFVVSDFKIALDFKLWQNMNV